MGSDVAFEDFKKRVRLAVEEALRAFFAACPATEVGKVAEYAVLGGGHRWRAMTTVAAGRMFHENAFDLCMPGACGLELAHAASLVLDDLPSMDDARFRRGRRCAHLVFARWAVDLAPAFMINMAYDVTLANSLVPAERRVRASLEVARAARCMFEGQEVDIAERAKGGTEENLLACYRLKTGALYAAAAKAGAIVCGAADEDAATVSECGIHLGLASQFHDDIADVVAGVHNAGKEAGRDGAKLTAVDLFGIEGTRKRASEFEEAALSKLRSFGPAADILRTLVCHANWTTE